MSTPYAVAACVSPLAISLTLARLNALHQNNASCCKVQRGLIAMRTSSAHVIVRTE